MHAVTQARIEEIIRTLWNRLTDEEIQARTERRDEFFLAVKKKHGITWAQAQLFLRHLEHQIHENSAAF